jgi:maltose alpha-D-glucosyltransferase / alpha-amylase
VAIEDLWYKNAIIYCLDVEKYMDANGDGVGDFEGLSRRLDYLAGLGVTCVWLQPFYPSPNRDNGYDVTDYYGVHAKHGSPGDFVEFMNHAKALGMRVIVDLKSLAE